MAKSKQLFDIFLSLFILGLLSFSLPSHAFAFSGSGGGVNGNPYQITTCLQLQEMENSLNAYYKLQNDIDCSATSSWNSGAGFAPISAFGGNFDGAGHTITDLYINRTAAMVGFIAHLDHGTVANVNLDSVDITGGNNSIFYAGGLVAYSDNGTISKASTTGVVSGTGITGSSSSYVGGLVGFTFGGSITDSYSRCLVNNSGTSSGNAYAGGLLAVNQATIQNVYAGGNVGISNSGTTYAGGLIGDTETTVKNSFAMGTASGSSHNGGLFGYCGIGATITNSYSVFSPLCSSDAGSTINGGSSAGVTYSDFFQTTPLHAVYTGTPAWDFTNTWVFNDTSSLPVLQFPIAPAPTPSPTPVSSSGNSSGDTSSAPSSTSAPTCGDAAPTTSPNFFQITTKGNAATLYFAPVTGPNNKYYISYGLTPDATGYGVEFNYSDTSGVIPYTINYLFPGTWYFKVRGGNGCMPGSWSQVMNVKVGLGTVTSTYR